MRQAAMYVRVSTDRQREEATIESQKSVLQEFAKDKGYEIPSRLIFEDNGMSGASLVRPALDNLRDFASDGLFDCVFVLSPDRLSRKYAYQVVLIEELKKNGVSVCFKSSPPSNSPGETLLEQMQGMFAEYERAQITERTRRGKYHKARSGCINVLTKAPYGYRYICATTCHSAYFEVHDSESSIVRRIFELYTNERLSIRKIVEYLLRHQIPSPKGNHKWSPTSVRDLLKNSAYQGIAYFGVRGKTETAPIRLPNRCVRLNGRKTLQRTSKERPFSEWIPIPVPSIISEEIFKLAQELRGRNKLLSKRNTKEGSLLQGLIACKQCGYGFTIKRSGVKSNCNSYYRCNNIDRNACGNRGIRTEQLDEAIWNSLTELLNNRELIEQEISRRLAEIKKEPIIEHKRQLKKKLHQFEQEANRLLDVYQEGCIEMPELKSRMQIIKREINSIKREISHEHSGLSQRQLLELNTAVEFFSTRLKESQKGLQFEEKRKILRMLIKDIQIGLKDIIVNHILPFGQNVPNKQNACLRSDHRNVELRLQQLLVRQTLFLSGLQFHLNVQTQKASPEACFLMNLILTHRHREDGYELQRSLLDCKNT